MGPNIEFVAGDAMGLIERTCLDCGRLNSAHDPCPYRDNRLILKSRLWARGITMMGPLEDEEKRRLRLLSSICVDFINGPHGRVRDKKDRIAAMRRDGRMNGKGEPEYISTGEAAKMLGTSRPMVQHHFDVKTLKGKKHPITGWRFVSRESVIAFMKKKGVKVKVEE